MDITPNLASRQLEAVMQEAGIKSPVLSLLVPSRGVRSRYLLLVVFGRAGVERCLLFGDIAGKRMLPLSESSACVTLAVVATLEAPDLTRV